MAVHVLPRLKILWRALDHSPLQLEAVRASFLPSPDARIRKGSTR
jgi:hypothetical protein